MKKISVLILLLSISICVRTACFGATDSLTNGIHFENGLSWKQIVAKAKLEKKYIFVDCFATWCGPCKKMDKEVYPAKEVGSYFNKKFISVKVQMDTAANDDGTTRAFYADAQNIRTLYRVNLYPTLLFFDSDGNLLNRYSGATDTASIVRFAEDVTDPKKNYYNLLEEYNKGRRNLIEMSYLAETAVNVFKDRGQAETIANQYLHSLNKQDRFTKENIEFMGSFTEKSNDFGFSFFYNNTAKINDAMKSKHYSQSVVQKILYNEYIAPKINGKHSSEYIPNWGKIYLIIARKYGEFYAGYVTLGAKADWAAKVKDYPDYTKYFIRYIEQYGPQSDDGGFWEAYNLNNDAWAVFALSSNVDELNIALKWSLKAVTLNPDPGYIDTYANILYKLKKTGLAIKWESIAANSLAHKNAEIESTLAKMKEGVPTWKTN